MNSIISNGVLRTQFDCEKNLIQAEHVSVSDSRQLVWWKCESGHSWAISPSTRIIRKIGKIRPCPYCSGRKASFDNNLLVTHPSLCKEWDTVKNDCSPQSVTHKMAKKVSWRCKYGHAWDAMIYSRASGKGCPKCNRRQTSHIELRMYAELKSLFPDTERDFRVCGWRVDVVIPSRKVAIEVDGSYWHKKKTEVDTRKDLELKNYGYKVFRVREQSLSPTGCDTVWYQDRDSHLEVCEKAIRFIIKATNVDTQYCGWKNEELYLRLLSEIGGHGRKAIEKNPDLENEWHPIRNGKLKCCDVSVGSGVNAWWKCNKGHEYQMMVKERTRGRGCPYCSGKRVFPEQSVASHFVVQEWNKELNDNPPTSFAQKSNKKVWWKCKNNHVWNASICSRTKGSGCPYCSHKRKNKETVEYQSKTEVE